jgi:hypothetical protein
MDRPHALAGLLTIAALLAACSPLGEPSPSPSPGVDDPGDIGPGIGIEVVRDGVRMTLQLDRTPIQVLERTWALVRIENHSTETILWQGGGCDFPASIEVKLAAAVAPAPGRDWPGLAGQYKSLVGGGAFETDIAAFQPEAFVDQPSFGCTADLRINELAVGERLEYRAAWDGLVGGAPAPGGPLSIRASFPFMGPKAAVADPFMGELQPIEAVLQTSIAAFDGRFLSPGEAVDAALSDARFFAWVEGAPMAGWQGVELQYRLGRYTAILQRLEGGGELHGAAVVDATTGAVLSVVIGPPPAPPG